MTKIAVYGSTSGSETGSISYRQCCGSGMFIPDPTFFHPGSELSPSQIPDPHQSILWIRILLSSSKNSKKNLDSYCFVTSFGLFIFENDVNVPSKSNKQKKLVFCWPLEGQ
jgi:hypothetical protein